MFDIESIKNLEDTQKSNFYRAKVISLNDPLGLNRIQVMIYGLTDDFENTDNLEDSPQPWCEFQFRDGVITYPNEGDIVWLFFEGGDIFRPVYLGTIYAGLDASCDAGWEKFISLRNIAPIDIDSYKINIKSANNLINPDDMLIVKDAHGQFKNFVMVEDNPFFVEFTGNKIPVDSKSPIILDGETYEYHVLDLPVHPKYKNNMPKNFKKEPNKMYVWYETENVTDEEIANGKTWKNILGGWKFYSDEELKKALAIFPDSLSYTNYKRYQTWAKMIDGAYSNRQPGFPNTIDKRPISWEFIPLPPWFFWYPEAMEEDSIVYKGCMSFPFGKMNLKTWKYWKQHNILSHSKKSAIELDDNDEYERLKIDFNYGAGGIEFSRAGVNGLDIWTDGILNIYVDGDTNENAEKVSRITFNECDLKFRGKRSFDFNAHKNFDLFAGSNVSISAKRGSVKVMTDKGFTISSVAGVMGGKREGTGNVSGENMWMGAPILSAPDAGCVAPMQGWFLHLDSTDGYSAAAASSWISYFNDAMEIVLNLCKAIMDDKAALYKAQAFNLILKGTTGHNKLKKWDIKTKGASVAKFANAWDKVQIQGGK